MVSYSDGNHVKYGTVIFYACSEDSDEVWMVLKELIPTESTLYERDMRDCLPSIKLNRWIDGSQIGKCFRHVVESDNLVVHSAKFLISRIVFVPDENGGFVSNILNSYQHD